MDVARRNGGTCKVSMENSLTLWQYYKSMVSILKSIDQVFKIKLLSFFPQKNDKFTVLPHTVKYYF